MLNPQLTNDGKLKHLLSIEGLPKAIIKQILDTAESFVGVAEREVKKVPLLRGKTVCNLFFENSTRTRTTFEIAAKRLSADVVTKPSFKIPSIAMFYRHSQLRAPFFQM